jgi:putative DNA primase/helicase
MEVRELLRRGAELDGEALFDPIEPDYSPTVAMFFWNGGKKPVIRSFAHGDCLYFLHADVLEGVESWFNRGCLISWTPPNRQGEVKAVRPIDSIAAGMFSAVLAGHYARRAENKEAYRFNGTHWEACADGHWDEVLSKLMDAGCQPAGYTSRYLSNVKSVLEASNSLVLPDVEEGWVPFSNVLLNPKDKTTKAVNKDNAYTWSLPWAYDATARCPFFLSWLGQATDNEASAVNLVRAFFNACLIGRSDIQKFLFVKGEGGTGKGTILRLLEAMLGEVNCATTELKLLDDSRFEAANIVGKRLVSISDAERYKGSMMKIKALTGQDNMRCEDKFVHRQYQRRFTGMVLILSNEQPGGTDYTSGFSRRLVVLQMDKRFTDEERSAFSKARGEERLRSEMPGIVNWALGMGWEEVSAAFSVEEGAVAAATSEALLAQNPVAAYVSECLVEKTINTEAPKTSQLVKMGVDRGTKVTEAGERIYINHETEIYPNYLQWCVRTHRQSSSLVRFSDELKGILADMGLGKRTRLNTGIGYLGLHIILDAEKDEQFEALTDTDIDNSNGKVVCITKAGKRLKGTPPTAATA